MKKNACEHGLRMPCRKSTLIMKISIVLLLLSLQVSATNYAQKLNLKENNISLAGVFKKIESQSNYRFYYSNDVVPSDKFVSVNVLNASIQDVLKEVFAGSDFTWNIVNKNKIVVSSRYEKVPAIEAAAFAGRITGVVTDENGDPLDNVSIIVKGTSTGTTTNKDGRFVIEITGDNAILEITRVGYETKEIVVSGNEELNIILEAQRGSMEEIVVVGYGTQKRGKVTAAISSVPMREIQDMPVSNVASALQGKIPGVIVQQSSGVPGSNPSIKVRGFGSINAGNSPLIVVDGNIVGPDVFALLNNNEIESIDVLKDASSSAIYGSRGANGVVMVTTKKGKAGRTAVKLDVYSGVQQVSKKMDILNSVEFADLAKEAANNAYLENVPGAKVTDPNDVRPATYLRYRYPRGEVFDWFDFDNPSKLPYYDFQDMIFRNARISNYQATISGGNEKVRFSTSGGYLDQEGIMLSSGLKRYSVRANVDADVSSKFRVGVGILPTYRIRREVLAEGHWASNAVINAALAAIPMAPVYADDGVTYSSQAAVAAPYNYPGVTNPLANITEYHSKLYSSDVLSNVYAEYKILPDLSYRASGNVNFNSNRRNAYRTSKMPLNQLLPPTVSTGSGFSDQGISWLFNQVLNYTRVLNEVHNLGALAGMESTKYNYQVLSASGSSYPNDLVETLNASASGSTTAASSSIVENSTVSYFARVNYSYLNKYLVNLSVRRDGSSIFGPNRRWGTFPAASVGWRVKDESFMRNLSSLSELKLRASYGLSGNNAFSSYYPYAALLSTDNYTFNNKLVNGLRILSPENRELSWEKNQQFDIGIDLGLFNNRIYLVADYYERITQDLLLSVNVPTITGFSTVVQNIGKMENKGWEFALNTRNFQGEFTWNTNANISFNRNKVLALGPTGDPIRSASGIGETNITLIGEPIGSFFGYKQIGIFKNQAELDAYPHDATSKPGDVKYEDVNKDGKINANDRTVIGNNQPDFIYGLTNILGYKGFDLNIAIQGTKGGEILNLSRRFYENLEGGQNQLTTVLNRWRSENDPGDGKTPRATPRTTGNNNAVSSRWVEDGSYLRIQNVSLGYRFPSSLVNKARLNGARVYISAQNLYTWTKYLGYNPEVSNYETSLTSGVDYGSFPLARTFIVGFNIDF